MALSVLELKRKFSVNIYLEDSDSLDMNPACGMECSTTLTWFEIPVDDIHRVAMVHNINDSSHDFGGCLLREMSLKCMD